MNKRDIVLFLGFAFGYLFFSRPKLDICDFFAKISAGSKFPTISIDVLSNVQKVNQPI